MIQPKNFNFKAHFLFSKKCKWGTLDKYFCNSCKLNRPLYQSQDLIRTLNIFTYNLSSLLLIQHKNFNFKAHFLFSKKCKGGILDKIFCNSCKLNRPLYQIQDLIRTLNIFSYYLSSLLLIQPKKFNFKAFFNFQKSVKGDPWQKFFATPAIFNRPLYQSQVFIRTLNIFTYYLSSLLLIQPKKFNFKAFFNFQKSVKGGQKLFQLLQTLTGYCTKVWTSFEI